MPTTNDVETREQKKYLRVKNWETLQHYKDRNPPWIKLYNCLLDDHEFAALADRDKGALILVWLLASRLKWNRIPYDPDWIRDRIGWKRAPNLTSFIAKGFLIVCESAGLTVGAHRVTEEIASNPLVSCKQDARPETETETEGDVETEHPPTPQRGKPSVSKKRKPRVGDPPGFDIFWTAYPRKVAKEKALQVFRKINPSAELLAEMLRAIEVQKGSKQWQREDGQYIPYPATWLNGRRWRDEIEPSSIITGGTNVGTRYAEVPSL